jgi:hypothetical protein
MAFDVIGRAGRSNEMRHMKDRKRSGRIPKEIAA